MGNFIDRTGDRYGSWTVLCRIEVEGRTKAYWLCRCGCGAEAAVEGSSLGKGSSRGCLACRKTKPRGRHVTYSAVHHRLTADRGPAREFDCVDCHGPAAEWSYDHQDLDEVLGRSGGKTVPYSLKSQHYAPRCKSCHANHDSGVRA